MPEHFALTTQLCGFGRIFCLTFCKIFRTHTYFFFQAIEDGAEIPPEAIRLLKKAMKQRRGSVDNVADTLMATLAAGGESQESVARAMVKVGHARHTWQGILRVNTFLRSTNFSVMFENHGSNLTELTNLLISRH